jgi:hypothetical protein
MVRGHFGSGNAQGAGCSPSECVLEVDLRGAYFWNSWTSRALLLSIKIDTKFCMVFKILNEYHQEKKTQNISKNKKCLKAWVFHFKKCFLRFYAL